MFNEQGFSRVSLRDISVRMGISPGNLTYHYRNREELLKAIYEQMYGIMEAFYAREVRDPLEVLARIPQQSREFIHGYRFFFADLRAIAQEFPWLAERHQQVVAKRLAGGEQLIKGLAALGHLHQEPFPGAYDHLVHLVWMVPTFWYNQHPVLPEGHPAHQEDHLQSTLYVLIKPYLTEQGLEKWTQINNQENETD